jgi:predicted metalloprotease with PDZ domain
VDVRNPQADRSYVTLEFPVLGEKNATFYMPAWAPGNYEICNFGRWIDSLQAYDSTEAALPVQRKNVNEWFIPSAKSLCKITYIARDIPEDSLDALPTTLSEMERDFYYFNGTAVFGYLKNKKNQNYHVTYKLPPDWRVWSGLERKDYFSFSASSYNRLVDCPVLAGGPRIRVHKFEVGQGKYTMAVNSESEIPMDSLIQFTKQCIQYQTSFFNETPFKEYLFIFNFSTSNARYGALEHLNSSAYFLPPPSRKGSLRNSFYTRVIAHELFHVWNPKLFYPEELSDFNYQDSIRITSMWFIEGVTEYYAKLTLVRSGLLPPSHLYDEMKNIALSDTREDLEYLSLRAAQLGVANSMYTKGAMIAYFMDLECRDKTDNKKSLDDAVLHIHKEFAQKKKPYNDRKLIQVIKEATGVDLKNFYKKYVRGKEPIPVSDYFEKGGLSYEYSYPPYYGWYFDVDDDGQLFVSTVSDNSTASGIGLQSGDMVREIQQNKIGTDMDEIRNYVQAMESLKVGDSLRIVVERNGTTKELMGKIKSGTQPNVIIRENPSASAKQASTRKSIVEIK